MGKFLDRIWTTFWKIPRAFGNTYRFFAKLVVTRSNGEFIPIVTYSLLGINSVLFFLGFDHPFSVTIATHGLIFHQFTHGGIEHLMSNMLFLLIFGPKCEKALNHFPFLGFYLLAGSISGFVFSLVYPDALLLGASGAIAGCLGLFPLLHKSMTAKVFNGAVVGGYLYLQIIALYESLVLHFDGGTAYLAHLIGFVFGLFVWLCLRPKSSAK